MSATPVHIIPLFMSNLQKSNKQVFSDIGVLKHDRAFQISAWSKSVLRCWDAVRGFATHELAANTHNIYLTLAFSGTT